MTEYLANFIFQKFALIGVVILVNLLSYSDITSLACLQYGPLEGMFLRVTLGN
jgi:hypothetical protein